MEDVMQDKKEEEDKPSSDQQDPKKRNPKAVKPRGKTFAQRGYEKKG